MAVADDTDDEDEGYARPREYYGSVSGSYRVASTDTGLITLVAAVAKHTHFVQRVHTEVTTGAASELWGVQDGATTPVPIVGSLSAAAIAHADRDFGANGVPCTEGTALTLNVSGATGAIGSVTWEGYKKLTRAAVVTPPLIRYAELVIADGASYYWRLGEPSGTTAVDSIGGANGTISGGVSLNQAGALSDGDKAMTFNGTTGKIVTAAGASAPLAVTIEAWVKTTFTADFQTVWSNRATVPTGTTIFGGLNLSGQLSLRTAALNFDGGIVVTDGRWHHVVYISVSNLARLFVDGVLDSEGSLTRTVTSSGIAGIGVDADKGLYFFNGSLDDVAIYPLALTPAQIAAHYQAGITLPQPV